MSDHGGYRQPSHPAPVSGPGAHSARTDRGPKQYDITGGSYGSSQDFQAQQSGAPLAPQAGSPAAVARGPQPQMPTPLNAPTQFVDQPVTSGADAGPGSSMSDAGITIPNENDAALRSDLGPYLQMFMRMADSQTSTPAFREQVRQLRARIQR